MDAAWVGVIGGAVGAAGTLAGSVFATTLAARHAKEARAEERSAELDRHWFDERTDLYLRLLASAGIALDAATHARGCSEQGTFPDGPDADEVIRRLDGASEEMLRDGIRLALFAPTRLQTTSGAIIAHLMEATPDDGYEPGLETIKLSHQKIREAYFQILDMVRDELGIGQVEDV